MRRDYEVFHSPSDFDVTNYYADDPVLPAGWYWWFKDGRVPHGPFDSHIQAVEAARTATDNEG